MRCFTRAASRSSKLARRSNDDVREDDGVDAVSPSGSVGDVASQYCNRKVVLSTAHTSCQLYFKVKAQLDNPVWFG